MQGIITHATKENKTIYIIKGDNNYDKYYKY